LFAPQKVLLGVTVSLEDRKKRSLIFVFEILNYLSFLSPVGMKYLVREIEKKISHSFKWKYKSIDQQSVPMGIASFHPSQ